MYKIILFLILSFTALGFRHNPNFDNWSISKNDPTIWVRFCSDAPASIGGRSFDAILQDVYDDWNAIPKSYIRLAFYPDDPANPGSPASGDSTFTTARAEGRIIDICFGGGSTGLGFGGHSKPDGSGSSRTCKVELGSSTKDDEAEFKQLFNHELLHCFGWNHSSDSDSNTGVRLSMDDKMMLTNLYPSSSSDGDEKNTLGLGCTI